MVAMSRQKNTVIEIQVFKLLFFYVKDILGRKKKDLISYKYICRSVLKSILNQRTSVYHPPLENFQLPLWYGINIF